MEVWQTLTKLHEWNLEFVRGTKEAEKYKELADKITVHQLSL